MKNDNENISLKNIYFLKDLVIDSFAKYWIDNTYCVFNSKENILYLVYSNEINSIISYDIIESKKINEIKNAHSDPITGFRHYFDQSNKKDLIISISSDANSLKLWDIQNLYCLFNIDNVYKKGYLYSATLFSDNYNNCIVTCNGSFFEYKIKVFNFEINEVKEINDSIFSAYFIDIYYDNIINKFYILTGNNGFVTSYDYKENKLYYKYGSNDGKFHDSIVINDKEKIIKLIDSSCSGEIKIFNFHSGNLLNIIKISEEWIKGICLWNNDYLFVACQDKSIKLLDLEKKRIIKNLYGHKDYVLTLKIIRHPRYGECLLSQGAYSDPIKIWIIKN